jgi:hypothetical protein
MSPTTSRCKSRRPGELGLRDLRHSQGVGRALARRERIGTHNRAATRLPRHGQIRDLK